MYLAKAHLFFLDPMAAVRPGYLYLAIALFVFITLVLVVCMIVVMLKKKTAAAIRSTIAGQLENWIMDIILENAPAEKDFEIPATIRILLHAKIAKKVLLDELVSVKKSLSGVSGLNVERVYHQLDLCSLSLNKLASHHWHIKAKGIQELAIMNENRFIENIFSLTNNKDLMVRMEAQTAMVRMEGYKGLAFFESLTYPLSEWHQLNLLYLLANHPVTESEDVKNWLHSSNPSVVQFGLKLIAEQHASQFHQDVVTCLTHPGETVRKEAILCLGQLPSLEAAEELNQHYNSETDKNLRICIINEFQKTGSDIDLPFLESLQFTDDADINLAANKSVLYLKNAFQ